MIDFKSNSQDIRRLSGRLGLAVVFTVFVMEGWAQVVLPTAEQSGLQGSSTLEIRGADDPFFEMWEKAVEALDESYDQWNFRPDETVDSTTFTINYIASLATDGRRRLDRVMILHADPNRDRSVTRAEAVSFLETQIGLKWITGDRLRLDDGRVLSFADFLRADTDQEDCVSKKEFVVAMWDRDGVDADFSAMDKDQNGLLEIHEYADVQGDNYRDVVSDFELADLNEDRKLSRSELAQAVPIHRRHLLDTNLAAFDDDGDQCLSLQEYRLSMLGNYNYPWELMPKDDDLDNEISFDEFTFHPRDLFQLQKRYYFHRLDLDGDGLLSQDEFMFQPPRVDVLSVMDIDGNQTLKLFESRKFPKVGSPAVRPAGKDVLFHAIPPEGEHQAVLMLFKLDGSESREIVDGLMPSWAPRGDRFACSRYKEGASVWIMGSDGTARNRIDDGWGAQWSPNGDWIAYRNDNGIRLYDTQGKRTLGFLDKKMHRFRYLHPFLSWSADGRQIAFFASTDHETQLVVVSGIEGLSSGGKQDMKPRQTTLFRTTEKVKGELLWDDGGVFLFSMFSREHGRDVIYRFDPKVDETPKVFERLIGVENPADITPWPQESKYVVTTAMSSGDGSDGQNAK